MTNADIIEKYKKGFSIKKVAQDYFYSLNAESRLVSKVNDMYIIRKCSKTKQECRDYVYKILYDYIKKGE